MYATIKEIKKKNSEIGHHFFDGGTMKFFSSRVVPTIHGGHFFITSEQCIIEEEVFPRLYTIRCALSSGEIVTVGPFQYYETLKEAKKDARQLEFWFALPFRTKTGEFRMRFTLPVEAGEVKNWYARRCPGGWEVSENCGYENMVPAVVGMTPISAMYLAAEMRSIQ